MTVWEAPASAAGVLHELPSFLPLQPPKEATTSPPAARMLAIAAWSDPPSRGRLPSHSGLQAPRERTNASVRSETPLAASTLAGACGLPHPRYSYGAAMSTGWAAASAGASAASQHRS